jgi:membrane protease YdiL (CAAX protease family)
MPTAATRSRPAARKPGARPVRRKVSREAPPEAIGGWAGYLQQSQTPLASLWFVIPLLVLHELGVRYYATLPGQAIEYRVTAFTLVARFLQTCGATGRYLPAFAVVAILLSWHVARRDRWVFNTPLPVVIGAMAVESVLLALPLVGVYFLFSSSTPTFMPVGEWKLMASLYLGAGVYEELVFRLGAFSVLSFLVLDLWGISRRVGVPVVVVTSAIVFGLYHLLGAGQYPYPALVFVALRGVFYGIIFLERGFGVTVGVHTAYDLLFLAVREVGESPPKLFSSP